MNYGKRKNNKLNQMPPVNFIFKKQYYIVFI